MSGKPDTSEPLEPVKAIMRSIIVANCNEPSLTVSKLCQLYQDFEGTTIPFRAYGFRDVNAFLSSMPDVMRMKSSSAGWTVELTGHSNSAHIAKLVAQQKPKDTRRRRKRSGRNQRNSNNSSRQYDSRPRPQPNSSINRYRYRPQYSSPEYREPATFSSDRRHNTQCQYMIPAGFESDTSESIEWPTNKNTGDKQPVRSTSCSSTINLPPAINSTPKATPIPCKKLSRLDVLRNMLNELKLKENSKLKPPPSPQVLSSGSDNETAVARARPPITVPVKPQNIDCNLDAQLLAKKSPTKHVEPVTKLWHESSDDDSFTEAMFTISHNNSVFSVDIPANCAELGVEIQPLAITQNVGEIFRIGVTEIHDPYRFWFQYDSQLASFDRMMHTIDLMYNSLDDRELRIHPLNCIANHLCMALFNKLWHRAKIINRSDDDTKVKVLYVDLGTTAEIPMANVKYMRNEFTKLPMQACRGCLDYIRPVETHWLRSTTMYFLKLLNDEPVYAKVTSIDDGMRLVRMVVTNTNGPIDVQVNQQLIYARHAKYYDPYHSSSSTVILKAKRHFSEFRPTCAMLESGTWPSFDEIGVLIEMGYDYYKELEENS